MIRDYEIVRKMRPGYKAKIHRAAFGNPNPPYPWVVRLEFKSTAGVMEFFKTWEEAADTLKLWHNGKVRVEEKWPIC